ncbi:unnamed protein product [Hermetia illucens]|uniref:Peroxidase n=2 Tax=Hermetia illucens TaxID=343691 RepID=A0A7R8V4C7_HERIL|nr:unnamed protein product [Hermetia illucens]
MPLFFATVILLFGVVNCRQVYIPEFTPVTYDVNKIPSNDWVKLDSIPEADYQQAINLGISSVNQDISLEHNLRTRGILVDDSKDDDYVQYLESKPNKRTRQVDVIAKKVIRSNKYFVNKHCLPENIDPAICAQFLATKPLPEDSTVHKECQEVDDRTIYAYTRLMPARYKDGIYQMYAEPMLPLPRRLTKHIDNSLQADHSDPEFNLLVMQWAQFIEHDLSKPVSTTMHNGDPIECCTSDDTTLLPRNKHPACAPLEGDETRDEYTHVSCQNYVRNAKTVNGNCTFGPAVMVNQENGKLDLSQLYGLSAETQAEMRTFRDGQLKSSGGPEIKTTMLPLATDISKYCVGPDNRECYMAGDSRVNSNPFITQLNTIFLRSHNIIAKQLKKQNPSYSDEKLFRLAKKRNIEKYVAIIYQSWLPTVLGEPLAITTRGVRSVHIETTVSSEFGVAAIRFYHSMMPDRIQLNKTCMSGSLDLSKHMYNSDFWKQDCKLSSLLDGMLNSNPHKVDLYYKPIVLKNCLKSKDSDKGINCMALDIQRGRDHGLAGYTKYLEKCANTEIRNWKSLETYIGTNELNLLKSMYRNVDDIDLIIGAMSEKQTNGLLGVTFSCIIADQFSKIWHEMPNRSDFNENESGAELLCRTTNIDAVPKNIFKVDSERNPLINCSTFGN